MISKLKFKNLFPERVTCCSATVRATALTTAGERTTQFWAEKPVLGKGRGAGWSWPEGPPAPQLELKNHPGSVYFGVLTSAAHQVVHAADQPDDQVLQYGGEKFGLTTLVRSALFPFGQFSRGRRNQGNPKLVVKILKDELGRWLRRAPLRLPTLTETRREFVDIA